MWRGRLAREPPPSPPAHVYFFGLPGNPVSTMVTFELFARPILEALAGMPPRKLAFLNARLKSDIKTKTGLKRFLPAILSGEFENAEVELAAWQGSGDIASMARANCYIVIPPDRERIAAGEWVPVLMRKREPRRGGRPRPPGGAKLRSFLRRSIISRASLDWADEGVRPYVVGGTPARARRSRPHSRV